MLPALEPNVQEMIRQRVCAELAAAVQQQQPTSQQQPMQLIINNHAESTCKQEAAPVQPRPETKEVQSGVKELLASPISRFMLFSVLGLGLYFLHGHLQHRWRMEEMHRRIDANLFLRITRLLGNATGS